jgi:hypothetical protein
MFTTLTLLASLLSQPAPQPAQVAGPELTLAQPSWAFAPMPSIQDEPEFPFGAAFADYIENERTEALMASVTPFAAEDSSQPFASLAVHAQPVLVESHPERW